MHWTAWRKLPEFLGQAVLGYGTCTYMGGTTTLWKLFALSFFHGWASYSKSQTTEPTIGEPPIICKRLSMLPAVPPNDALVAMFRAAVHDQPINPNSFQQSCNTRIGFCCVIGTNDDLLEMDMPLLMIGSNHSPLG